MSISIQEYRDLKENLIEAIRSYDPPDDEELLSLESMNICCDIINAHIEDLIFDEERLQEQILKQIKERNDT